MNKTLQQLFIENKIPEAIQVLLLLTHFDHNLQNEVTQISARYEEWQRKERNGLLDNTALNVEISQIRTALIDIESRIEKSKKLGNPFSGLGNSYNFKPWIVILFAIGFMSIGYLPCYYLHNRIDTHPIIENNQDSLQIKFYKNEIEAHPEIEKELINSKKHKIYIIKGNKLFKENEGLLYLKKYKKADFHPLHEFQVLLLDFDNTSNEQYERLRENISASWENREDDTNTQHRTVNTINSLKPNFNIKYRVYNPNNFQYFKMFIFDDYCYFTIYHRIGIKPHQDYRFIKVGNKTPIYESLESIFDTNWEKAN